MEEQHPVAQHLQKNPSGNNKDTSTAMRLQKDHDHHVPEEPPRSASAAAAAAAADREAEAEDHQGHDQLQRGQGATTASGDNNGGPAVQHGHEPSSSASTSATTATTRSPTPIRYSIGGGGGGSFFPQSSAYASPSPIRRNSFGGTASSTSAYDYAYVHDRHRQHRHLHHHARQYHHRHQAHRRFSAMTEAQYRQHHLYHHHRHHLAAADARRSQSQAAIRETVARSRSAAFTAGGARCVGDDGSVVASPRHRSSSAPSFVVGRHQFGDEQKPVPGGPSPRSPSLGGPSSVDPSAEGSGAGKNQTQKEGGKKNKEEEEEEEKAIQEYPPKPKRPLSAYNVFFKAQRKEILKDAGPGERVGFKKLAQAVAARWKDADAGAREKYVELAAADKDRYKREMDRWKAEISKIDASEALKRGLGQKREQQEEDVDSDFDDDDDVVYRKQKKAIFQHQDQVHRQHQAEMLRLQRELVSRHHYHRRLMMDVGDFGFPPHAQPRRDFFDNGSSPASVGATHVPLSPLSSTYRRSLFEDEARMVDGPGRSESAPSPANRDADFSEGGGVGGGVKAPATPQKQLKKISSSGVPSPAPTFCTVSSPASFCRSSSTLQDEPVPLLHEFLAFHEIRNPPSLVPISSGDSDLHPIESDGCSSRPAATHRSSLDTDVSDIFAGALDVDSISMVCDPFGEEEQELE